MTSPRCGTKSQANTNNNNNNCNTNNNHAAGELHQRRMLANNGCTGTSSLSRTKCARSEQVRGARSLEQVQKWQQQRQKLSHCQFDGDEENCGVREYPTLTHDSVVLGPKLGVGGFGIVFQIKDILLKDDKDDDSQNKDKASSEQASEDTTETDNTAHEHHYDVRTAKQFMAKHVLRFGQARYAIKKLLPTLSQTELQRGKFDLAIEATLLSTLWHPNIIRMRAIRQGDPTQEGFFIVMDCLVNTLDQRVIEWSTLNKEAQGSKSCLFCAKNNNNTADAETLRDLLQARLWVARDLASALVYLHNHGVVYRDLKQPNVGFDVRENVKLFDFGLAKPLPGKPNADGFYQLTPCTGSLPTMAPEVVLAKPYNQSCDVFSFGILLWEILSLQPAFNLFSPADFKQKVAIGGFRPSQTSSNNISSPLQGLIKSCWHVDPHARPTMAAVKDRLAKQLQMLLDESAAGAPAFLNRTRHLNNVSSRSWRFLLSEK